MKILALITLVVAVVALSVRLASSSPTRPSRVLPDFDVATLVLPTPLPDGTTAYCIVGFQKRHAFGFECLR